LKLTVKDAAKEIGETSAVVRNWIRDFKTLIPTEKGENGYHMFGPEALGVLRTIKKLHREQGFSTKMIEHFLATGEQVGATKEIEEVKPGQLDAIQSMLETILEKQQQNEDMNRIIMQRMDEREKRLDDRDKLLTEFITDRREQKTLMESYINQPKRKLSLWDRLTKPKR
jgi:DNA-binding transcriptional MerR regulator